MNIPLFDPIPWWHYSNYLSAMGSVAFHAALVLVLALIQEGDPKEERFNTFGSEIAIGNMPIPSEPLNDAVETELQSDPEPREVKNAPDIPINEAPIVRTPSPGMQGASEFKINIASMNTRIAIKSNYVPQSERQGKKGEQPPRKKKEREDTWEELLDELRRNGLDIVITFDSTKSMRREIEQVKRQINRIGRRLIKLVPNARISICTYRDYGDDYLVKGLPLDNDLSKIEAYLNRIQAGGGGDFPEAVNEGLAWSMSSNDFRPKARKVILLFGDALPHRKQRKTCLQLAAGFRRREKGIVSTVTCRASKPMPDFVDIARSGGGEAFTSRNEKEIMTQLMILVFGSRYKEYVKKALNLK